LAILTVLAATAIVPVLNATAEATGTSVHAGLAAPEQSSSGATATPLTATSSPSSSASAPGSSAGSSSSEPSTASSASSSTTSGTATAVSQTTESAATSSPSSTVSSSATDNSEATSSAPIVQTVAPATPPAAAQSPIGRGTVLIALAVLLIAIAVVALVVSATRRRPGSQHAPTPIRSDPQAQSVAPAGAPAAVAGAAAQWSSPVDGSSLDDLMAFMVELGDTMVDSGDPVTHVGECLERVADVNGVRGAEIIVLPTALIITLPGMRESRTEVATTGRSRLRLDQVEAVFTVADAAERGDIGPRAARDQLRSARELPPSFSSGVIVLGHAVIAMGLAVILAGRWTDIAVAAVLGAGVGLIKQLTAGRRLAIQVLLPVLCAFLVAAAVALLGRTAVEPQLLPPILGALVTFIPGGLLTTAVIELATGQMISGASRLVYGTLQLVLLSLGIIAGLQMIGIPAVTFTETDSSVIGAIAPWLGVLIFGIGVLLSYSGRPRSLGWMLLVLYVAFAGQVIGGLLFGSSLSAFVGAAVMTPVAVFVATQRTGPPTLVTFLPAFWLLVPGAIALVGVTQIMGEATVDGTTSILTAGVTIVSIALGVVLGLGLGDWVTRVFRRPVSTQ
jgi:uncharacterized membrane protein YjjP (DUF1212 family)